RVRRERSRAVDEADPIAPLGDFTRHSVNGALIGEVGAKEFGRAAVSANGIGDIIGALSRAVVVNAYRPAIASKTPRNAGADTASGACDKHQPSHAALSTANRPVSALSFAKARIIRTRS